MFNGSIILYLKVHNGRLGISYEVKTPPEDIKYPCAYLASLFIYVVAIFVMWAGHKLSVIACDTNDTRNVYNSTYNTPQD